MTFPDIEIRISSPGQFIAVLRQAKACLANGTLRQIRSADTSFAADDVANVPEEGPWPDFVEADFEDRGGRRYRLAVETYHGRGGAWERVLGPHGLEDPA